MTEKETMFWAVSTCVLNSKPTNRYRKVPKGTENKVFHVKKGLVKKINKVDNLILLSCAIKLEDIQLKVNPVDEN